MLPISLGEIPRPFLLIQILLNASKPCIPCTVHRSVLGVPVQSKALGGVDSLLSIVQMPAGIPVGTLAIGQAGAVNAGILAGSIVALQDNAVAAALAAWRKRQTDTVPKIPKVT